MSTLEIFLRVGGAVVVCAAVWMVAEMIGAALARRWRRWRGRCPECGAIVNFRLGDVHPFYRACSRCSWTEEEYRRWK
jgi:hypothetical protein